MDQSFATRAWLEWLTRVRLLTVTLILTVGFVWPQYVPGLGTNRFFLPLIIFWITLGILHLILLRWLPEARDRKSTRLNSSHGYISYAVFCLKKKKKKKNNDNSKKNDQECRITGHP